MGSSTGFAGGGKLSDDEDEGFGRPSAASKFQGAAAISSEQFFAAESTGGGAGAWSKPLGDAGSSPVKSSPTQSPGYVPGVSMSPSPDAGRSPGSSGRKPSVAFNDDKGGELAEHIAIDAENGQ